MATKGDDQPTLSPVVDSKDRAITPPTLNSCMERLMRPHKTIRDAVHGDIKVTELEIQLMDTSAFQRLHGIRQLGTTYMVYPSAKHTRFEHALGCLFMTQLMIDNINNNPYPEVKINERDRFMLRIVALLHDLAHIPFGHTLENEGALFPRSSGTTRRSATSRRSDAKSSPRPVSLMS
jgi:hypothetical protein